MNNSVMKYITLFTQFFLYMVIPIAGCSVFGWWLDQKFGTSFIVILLFFVGALAGMNNIYRLAMKMTKSDHKGKENGKRK